MMDLYRFLDINLALTATLSGGFGSAALPLINMQDDSRYTGAPARCETPADLTTSKFEVLFPTSRAADLIALVFHNFSLAARYRVTLSGSDGNLATPVWESGWVDVYGVIYANDELEWDDDNFWTGKLAKQDLGLYPPHLWIPLASKLATRRIRIEIDDATNEAGFLDIGGLIIGRTYTSTMNFERGRELSMTIRDLVDEAPSGRRFYDERRPRRVLTMTFARLLDREMQRLFDAGARAGSSRPVVILPESDDPKSLLREAFPATFGALPSATFTYAGLGRTTGVFQEIIA